MREDGVVIRREEIEKHQRTLFGIGRVSGLLARGEKQGKEKDRTPPEGEKTSNPVENCESNPAKAILGAILDLGGKCQRFRGETGPHPRRIHKENTKRTQTQHCNRGPTNDVGTQNREQTTHTIYGGEQRLWKSY